MHLALPAPGKTTVFDASETIDLENVSLNGGFLVKVLVLSIDPYMRGRMRDASKKSYNVSHTMSTKHLPSFNAHIASATTESFHYRSTVSNIYTREAYIIDPIAT